MAEFNGQIITNKGRDLLGRALAGEGKIVFTKAAFGDQKQQGNAREVTELKNKKLDLTIMHIRNDSGTAVLTIQATNEHVEESFKTEEFGVYAKLENDKEEILYSYTTAIEADFFPNNKLGTTYEFISEVYMAIDSNADPEIHVKEGVVFLTRDIADEIYTSTGVKAVGELKERTNLEENKAYRDNLGKWYKNIGGNRSWNKSDKPDNKLVPITWDLIFTQQQEAEKSKVNVKDIVNNLTSDASDKPLAAAQGKILEQLNKAVLGKVDGSFPLTSATKDKVYYCQPLAKFYRCKESYSGSQLTSPNDKFYEISVFDNSDRLNNLCINKINMLSNPQKTVEAYNFKIGLYNLISGRVYPTNANENIYLDVPGSQVLSILVSTTDTHNTSVSADIHNGKIRIMPLSVNDIIYFLLLVK